MSLFAIQTGAIQPDVIRPLAASVGAHVASGAEGPEIAAQARWYAVYTCANHEKRVAGQFASRSVEHFFPQYESLRRWKDRSVRLQLPLFPGYLFVHLAAPERLRVLQVPGVVRVVGFNGSPAPMPEEDINRIREFLSHGFRAEPHKYLQVGRRVRVKAGPLAGIEGIFLRARNKCRIVLSMELIMRSIVVEIDMAEVEPVR